MSRRDHVCLCARKEGRKEEGREGHKGEREGRGGKKEERETTDLRNNSKEQGGPPPLHWDPSMVSILRGSCQEAAVPARVCPHCRHKRRHNGEEEGGPGEVLCEESKLCSQITEHLRGQGTSPLVAERRFSLEIFLYRPARTCNSVLAPSSTFKVLPQSVQLLDLVWTLIILHLWP